MRFPIVVHKDAGSGYGVTVPDLPGCFSAGDTLDEVIESAREAIACHIDGLLMDGEPIPARASLEAHQGNDDYRGGVWAIADVDILTDRPDSSDAYGAGSAPQTKGRGGHAE